MGLLEEHKSERRERILAAARGLVAKGGYAGLTMRELARAARVSVPTLYNLFGGKDAILAADLVARFAETELLIAAHENFIDRALAGLELGLRQLAAAPDFYRELVHVFVNSPELRPIRSRVEALYIASMTATLLEGQRVGHIETWVSAAALAEVMFAQFLCAMLRWGAGELDFEGLRSFATTGICLQLLGVARGEVKNRVRELIETRQRQIVAQNKEYPNEVIQRNSDS